MASPSLLLSYVRSALIIDTSPCIGAVSTGYRASPPQMPALNQLWAVVFDTFDDLGIVVAEVTVRPAGQVDVALA